MSDVCRIEYRNYRFVYRFLESHVNFMNVTDIVYGFRGREYLRITPSSMRRLVDVMNRYCQIELAIDDITPVVVGNVRFEFVQIQEAWNESD